MYKILLQLIKKARLYLYCSLSRLFRSSRRFTPSDSIFLASSVNTRYLDRPTQVVRKPLSITFNTNEEVTLRLRNNHRGYICRNIYFITLFY